MKKVQHQQNINCHSEIRKKCTRIMHYSVQMDNDPFIDGPLYTDLNVCGQNILQLNSLKIELAQKQ